MKAMHAMRALGGALLAATTAMSQTTAATETSTITGLGVRPEPLNSEAFLIQGPGFGFLASYGVIRWDLSGIQAFYDGQFGAGQWQVDAVRLELGQQAGSPTIDGNLNVFYSSDDTTNIKAGSALVFTDNAAPLGIDITSSPPLLSYSYVFAASGAIDTQALPLTPDITTDVLTGDTLTLVFAPLTPSMAATYRGQTPELVVPIPAPTIVVEASATPAVPATPLALVISAAALATLGGAVALARR